MNDSVEIINKLIAKHNINAQPIKVKDFIAYKIEANNLLSFLTILKESEDLRFTILTDLFGADFPERARRFEVVYNLLSLKLNRRLLLKIAVAENETPLSITKIFNAACWYEREIFDMFGISFENSHDMRRILTDYGFEGHPLRKDFPLTGYTQVKYDETLQKVIYEPVKLDIEYREFDFSSPWQGPSYVLPGDEKTTNVIPAKAGIQK
ncbi:NADH-quinone oxidoreductase subunit C [Rickettsia endosymbiont of Halotydeus destructor]|uniref:NADH-quinone oxidoreductase subunit C n=1 Tax=Rickettsia endosymbiont of Halotydeus destructor TaxID=2996754 RepID=UPI003BB19178